MRAIWKGAVSFGLVTVPVRLYSATENHDIQFRQVRASDGSRIRYKRVAEADGEEVPYDEITKGYETADGRMVVLSDDDLASLPSRSSKEISVEKFVPAEQIDPMLLDKSYYLEPEGAAAKPYALLREALRDTDRVAVVTVSIRTRLTMAVLRVRDDVIVCQTMLWPDEIRAADFGVLDDVPDPTDKEVAMANLLVESLADDFEPNAYEDDYAKAVEKLVARKIDGAKVVAAPEPEEDAGQVVDLLAALQKSVERAKAGRGAKDADEKDTSKGSSTTSSKDEESDEDSSSEGKAEKKAAPTKSAAKKTAARKAPAKKKAATKSTEKDTASEGEGSGGDRKAG
ncbi:non-homologous end joining protein Ku [Mobilicoccus pelagius]|uniref:Non-homologous end joining protein Ku n=1 Tax=Mobilicoccus pelagius NBRC 104925 TaxID=1089455 RepID=H5US70_9MICO|nr:Ku protein [Mobilicoccus pelagius]GAB48578.1 putative DNA end-binding protein Ku [Mobilicoccus pelagius NBRC 104925]